MSRADRQEGGRGGGGGSAPRRALRRRRRRRSRGSGSARRRCTSAPPTAPGTLAARHRPALSVSSCSTAGCSCRRPAVVQHNTPPPRPAVVQHNISRHRWPHREPGGHCASQCALRAPGRPGPRLQATPHRACLSLFQMPAPLVAWLGRGCEACVQTGGAAAGLCSGACGRAEGVYADLSSLARR